MTNKEATYLLKTLLKKHIHNGTYDRAIKIGLKALEKQIPKKPIIKPIEYPFLYSEIRDDDYDIVCPACHKSLDEYTDSHHCTCGQAIDWSEEE